MEREVELSLIKQAQAGNTRARDRLIASLMPVIRYAAKRWASSGVDEDDLIQEGAIGAMRAIEKYSPDRGAKLSTYAQEWIHAAVRAYVVDRRDSIRVPRYAHLKGHRVPTVSLDAPIGDDDGGSRHELVSDESVHDVLGMLDNHALIELLATELDAREHVVVRAYLGIEARDSLNFVEIADRLKMSTEGVRQIYLAALAKLRKKLR